MNPPLIKTIALFLTFALALLVACLPVDADAHESPIKRELLVQLSQDNVLVLLSFELPAGEQVDRLMVRYDLDHDATIGELEAPRLASVLLPLALKGLSFEVLDERPGAEEPEVKIKRTKDGRLAMAVLMTYTLPKKSSARALRITLAPDPHAFDTSLVAQTVLPLQITKIQGRTLDPPLTQSSTMKLAAGQSQLITVSAEAHITGEH